MPISRDDFRAIGEEEAIDLSRDTTQGTIYRFLLENASAAFRQREFAASLDVPQGSIGPTLSRLEDRELVEHRGEYWSIADPEHALASAGRLGAATADELDGGFSDATVDAWQLSAVDPIEDRGQSEADRSE